MHHTRFHLTLEQVRGPYLAQRAVCRPARKELHLKLSQIYTSGKLQIKQSRKINIRLGLLSFNCSSRSDKTVLHLRLLNSIFAASYFRTGSYGCHKLHSAESFNWEGESNRQLIMF